MPLGWPKSVAAEADALPDAPTEADKRHRIDLREQTLVTIDGEDARDFDDAIACRAEGDGWQLQVAIADVSSYVGVGTALDDEACRRGTSVYFPNRVLPMLPEALSNGLCSLKPEVERLCLVCEMDIDAEGRMRDFRFFEGLMRSAARLTYTEVGAVLGLSNEAGAQVSARCAEMRPLLAELHSLCQTLRRRRAERDAIDFQLPEFLLSFGADGAVADVRRRQPNPAYQLVEECMLCANVAAAEFLRRHRLPALYRVHEPPSPDNIESLRVLLNSLGLSMPGGEFSARHMRRVHEASRGKPLENLVQMSLLRAMQRACYGERNLGHFGLQYKSYAHFTSPIRRYPDLLVHRAIRSVIRGDGGGDDVRRCGAPRLPKESLLPYDNERMAKLGEQCSALERRADEAGLAVQQRLVCAFLRDRAGEEFAGLISGFLPYGIFVQLTDYGVDGLLHISELSDDFYVYIEERHLFKGRRNGRVFRMGDVIQVALLQVNVEQGRLQLGLPDADGARRRRRRRRGWGGRTR